LLAAEHQIVRQTGEAFQCASHDDPDDSRFELALDLLRESGEMSFRDLYVSTREGRLDVRLESSWSPDQTDASRAARDISRARQNIQALREVSPRFAAIVEGIPVRIALFYGYGMGAIDLCEEVDGNLRWLWPVPKT